MGGCVSRPPSCMGGVRRKSSSATESGPRRRRRPRGSAMRRRISSRAAMETITEADAAAGEDATPISVDSANYNNNHNYNANAAANQKNPAFLPAGMYIFSSSPLFSSLCAVLCYISLFFFSFSRSRSRLLNTDFVSSFLSFG